jgi:hypothetical protein
MWLERASGARTVLFCALLIIHPSVANRPKTQGSLQLRRAIGLIASRLIPSRLVSSRVSGRRNCGMATQFSFLLLAQIVLKRHHTQLDLCPRRPLELTHYFFFVW